MSPQTTVARDLSLEVQRRVRAKDGECFRNAALAIATFPPSTKHLRYVEGYATAWFGPTLHGWLEYRGAVIETTPCWLDPGVEGHVVSYFGARRWQRWEVLERAFHRGALLPLVGRDEWRDPDFQRALVFAQHHAMPQYREFLPPEQRDHFDKILEGRA